MESSIENWMCRELMNLGIDATEENARYILSMNTHNDLEDYLCELLDSSDPKVRLFLASLFERWRPPGEETDNPPPITVYQKKKEEETYIQGKHKSKPKKKERDKNTVLENGDLNGPDVNSFMTTTSEHFQDDLKTNCDVSPRDQKKKSKFIALFSQEGQEKSVIKLQGRHVCECQALKHKLVNNCIKCGRVVCEQEGSGPCLFCGNLVCTNNELAILSQGSKKSEALLKKLKNVGVQPHMVDRDFLPNASNQINSGMEKAVRHKDKLLEYDRTSVRRTHVIDDESDYFSTDTNQWLSSKDREALRKREEELRAKRFASRKDRKVTLDFAGRQVLEESDTTGQFMYDADDDVVQQVHYGARPKEFSKSAIQDQGNSHLVNPSINQPAPLFVPSKSSQKRTDNLPSSIPNTEKKSTLRIQDRELQEMSDDGMCLSMHQPWASLLIKGIKLHEGRTWYTSHRGRLWIAATAQQPVPHEIKDVEQSYRYLYDDTDIEFPSHYPVGCLLGSVEVDDCLSQEEYREKFPDGESASPYVLLCKNSQELVVKFPIKGKHKIYKLDSHVFQAAKKGLRKT